VDEVATSGAAETRRPPRPTDVDYSEHFLSPSIPLMAKVGLWIEMYAARGVGVGVPDGSAHGAADPADRSSRLC
jgi:hypothetical protein